MRTRVLAVVAALCLLITIFVVWRQFRGGEPLAVESLGPASPEAAELTRWAAAVRQAGRDGGAKVVAERFHAEVPPERREALARQIALRLLAAESPTPRSLRASTRGAVQAVWKCTPAPGSPAELALLFVRGDGGRLELSGLMP